MKNDDEKESLGARNARQSLFEEERQRLQLVVACAVRMLIAHMGTDSFYMPFEGEILLIQKVRQR